MNQKNEDIKTRITTCFEDKVNFIESSCNELIFELQYEDLIEVAKELKTNENMMFEQLTDLCGVDYLTYGVDEWITKSATSSGFSRGVSRQSVILDDADTFDDKRFAVIYNLLSIKHNSRIRLRVYTGDKNPPIIPSVSSIWSSANWLERETFDLYGILFEGHPDLRRILTDYGFVGHPFRKDFPLSGNVEIHYDEKKEKIVYKPVSIEPRTLVPRVIRQDNRYSDEIKGDNNG
ncbi:MAG: NADH-quinone oxidoreductase subunit C [Woeseiaceae bacterium]|nr:NADH-quinone oxidoreductase subunit C [Woeseiaceae bacterium]